MSLLGQRADGLSGTERSAYTSMLDRSSRGCDGQLPHVVAEQPGLFSVWNKPWGWSCASGRGGQATPLLVDHIRQMSNGCRPLAADPTCEFGLLHRLDTQTSGAVLVALTYEFYWRLALRLAARAVHRNYLCLCAGTVPVGAGSQAGLAVDEHLLLTRRTVTGSRKRGRVQTHAVPTREPGSLPARTLVQIVASLKSRCGGSLWHVVKASPFTGRTHQIRAHTVSRV
eukprot:TRINITY_DN38432_c0_g1_i2.p1 TRINITY_DN38432_c0_g1~~TRINITY_DN38432_c0_g1_i2.p1  ORF type:complete len:262 (+),score=4.13 TRINITY_DN38432_c0_g1_i2:107-787(+)